VPEEGWILYAALATPTDFVHSERIVFQRTSTSGDTAVQPEIPVRTPLSSHIGPLYPPCPDWTEDGRFVAFNDGRNITIFDTRENELQEIEVDFDFLPTVVWSPDQTKLAFSGNSEAGPSTSAISSIWLADLRKMSWQPLVECENCVGPTWHPDGSRIAYANRETDSIEVFDLRAGNIIDTFRVTGFTFSTYGEGQGPLLAWSPQGNRIAFSANHPDYNAQHIFLLNLETGDIDDLTWGEEQADSPTWSPSGEQLLYRVVRAEEPPLPSEGPWKLDTSFVIRSVDERNRMRVLLSEHTSPIISCPNWLPLANAD
jgi:dipeptidyl aminopeptidase/acylaminoacyl peptidase